MKKIIFVMPNFGAGGAEKSLLMLLYMLKDIQDVQVDVLFFKKEGIFLEQIPKEINIIDAEQTLKTAYSGFSFKNIKSFRTATISFMRPFATAVCKIMSRSERHKRQIRWNSFYKKLILNLPGKYDYACGYLDGEALYYVVDKINADKKYGWNQNDYKGLLMSEKIDSEYYARLDRIVTLSDVCLDILQEVFPSYADKMLQIPPIVTSDYINNCADKFFPEEYGDEDGFRIISVGRLVEQKGFDMAIEAAAILNNKGVKFKWFIIGNGELYESLHQLIEKNNLTDRVILLGEHGNPYPYIKNADVFVQSSRYEGKSVVLNETKMLAKPILATHYPTVTDQITNGEDGIIVDMNAESIAKGLEELINDEALQCKLHDNLSKLCLEDAEVVNAYLKLFELM